MENGILGSAYAGKRVLVTGHTGFKGSWLSIWLRELGAKVIGYSLAPPTQPSNFGVCGLEGKIVHVLGDVRDLDRLMAVFAEHEPEIVFHLAAQPLVRRSYAEPKTTFDTNVGGTVNVLEAVRLNRSVEAFVNVTSDKCYENREWVWGYRENDPMGGHDPYSASKGCAELVFSAYANSFFARTPSGRQKIGLASVRAGNVIGGGDWAEDRLIPDSVRALAKNEPVGVRSPRSIRPWQHVLEPLGGYLLLGALLLKEPDRYGGAWNFGPNGADNLSVAEVVGKLIRLWGSGAWEDLSGGHDGLHEAGALRLCCDKAETHLMWRCALGIDECLRYTVEWYKLFYSNGMTEDMYRVCKEQIERYTEKAREMMKGPCVPAMLGAPRSQT